MGGRELLEVKIEVFYGKEFWDFDYRPLNIGWLLNTVLLYSGSTVCIVFTSIWLISLFSFWPTPFYTLLLCINKIIIMLFPYFANKFYWPSHYHDLTLLGTRCNFHGNKGSMIRVLMFVGFLFKKNWELGVSAIYALVSMLLRQTLLSNESSLKWITNT